MVLGLGSVALRMSRSFFFEVREHIDKFFVGSYFAVSTSQSRPIFPPFPWPLVDRRSREGYYVV